MVKDTWNWAEAEKTDAVANSGAPRVAAAASADTHAILATRAAAGRARSFLRAFMEGAQKGKWWPSARRDSIDSILRVFSKNFALFLVVLFFLKKRTLCDSPATRSWARRGLSQARFFCWLRAVGVRECRHGRVLLSRLIGLLLPFRPFLCLLLTPWLALKIAPLRIRSLRARWPSASTWGKLTERSRAPISTWRPNFWTRFPRRTCRLFCATRRLRTMSRPSAFFCAAAPRCAIGSA